MNIPTEVYLFGGGALLIVVLLVVWWRRPYRVEPPHTRGKTVAVWVGTQSVLTSGDKEVVEGFSLHSANSPESWIGAAIKEVAYEVYASIPFQVWFCCNSIGPDWRDDGVQEILRYNFIALLARHTRRDEMDVGRLMSQEFFGLQEGNAQAEFDDLRRQLQPYPIKAYTPRFGEEHLPLFDAA